MRAANHSDSKLPAALANYLPALHAKRQVANALRA